MNYKWLRVGDVRQEGDESRRVAEKWDRTKEEFDSGPWQRVSLVGEPILRSDLMHLQFRRPQ